MSPLNIVIGVLGAGIGSGLMAIVMAVIQRKWKKDDQQNLILEKLESISQRMDRQEAEAAEREAKHSRIRILRFGDECSHDVKHSREHFEQVIEDVDAYESFCTDHPEFKNNKAVMTIRLIKETYQNRLKNNDFI